MQIKTGLVALSAVATLVLVSGNSVEARSEGTDKKDVKKTEKVVEKAPEPVIETVKPGDTLTAIAEKHQTSYIRLFNANDGITNPDLINVDQQVRIPREDEALPDRMSQVPVEIQTAVMAGAASVNVQPKAGTAPRGAVAGNTYVSGTCTWHVKNMRPDLPNMLGNGGQWSANARAQGIPTGTTPRVGAVAEQSGHVAYVEAVNADGTVTVSEMGYAGVSGVHRRTVPASTFFSYIY